MKKLQFHLMGRHALPRGIAHELLHLSQADLSLPSCPRDVPEGSRPRGVPFAILVFIFRVLLLRVVSPF
jgi:hypothetical protein